MTEKIKTEDIVRWLRTLPPDEPFCRDQRCPVAEFAWRERMRLLSNDEAVRVNPTIAFISDAKGRAVVRKREFMWQWITPRDILEFHLSTDMVAMMLAHERIAGPRLLSCTTR